MTITVNGSTLSASEFGTGTVTPCHPREPFNGSAVLIDSHTLCLGICKPIDQGLPMIMNSPISVRSVLVSPIIIVSVPSSAKPSFWYTVIYNTPKILIEIAAANITNLQSLNHLQKPAFT